MIIAGAAVWMSMSAKTIKTAADELRAYRCGKTIRIKTTGGDGAAGAVGQGLVIDGE